jgi:membrane-bound ClpP family serine protease
MSLVAIVLIILGGIVLLLVEFLIIPGVSVFGIAGFLCLIGGVIASYVFHGNTAGHITLAAAVIASVIAMIIAFRRKTWKKMGLGASIDSRIAAIEPEKIKSGDTGKAITRLAPMGKVKVNDIVCEAKSISGYIHEDTEIEVIKVSQYQLIVKLKT